MSYSVEENTSQILRYVDDASAKGSDLVAFPELAVTGCHRKIKSCCEHIQANSEWIDSIRNSAKRHRKYIAFGAPTYSERGIHDGYLLISPEGELTGSASKLGLTESEATYFCPGETRKIWKLNDLKVGVVFCREIADLEELERDYRNQVDFLLWPCFSSVHEQLPSDIEQMSYEQAQRVAKQLEAVVLQSNWANSLNSPEITNTGGSVFVSSEGTKIAAAPLGESGFGIVDSVDLSFEWFGRGGV